VRVRQAVLEGEWLGTLRGFSSKKLFRAASPTDLATLHHRLRGYQKEQHFLSPSH
jgi:hypothetical protein